ncbi:thiol reductant ABC exporter subunit CydC [Bermanella sp. R86510]|uniref:thiol reductant ABC exporter subunit CydC n=1 Tax=unclassified Bermanella TaxID=2627862 RepID=UPI0037C90B49
MKDLLPWIQLISKRPKRLIIGAILIMLTVMAAVALLGLSGHFITATGLAGIIITAGGSAYLNIYTPAGGIRAFALLRTVGRYMERIYNHNTVLSLLARLRIHLFNHLSQLSWQQQGGQRHGQWLNRLTHDINTLDNLYLRLLAPPVVAFLSSLILVIVTAIWLPQAAFYFFIGVAILFILCTALPALLTQRLGFQLSANQEALRYEVLDHIQGMAELKSAHCMQQHQEKLWERQQALQQAQAAISRIYGLCQSIGQQWLLLLVLFQLVVGINGFLENQLSGPIFVMLVLATLGLNEAFINLSKSFSEFGQTQFSAQRLNQLTLAPAIHQASNKIKYVLPTDTHATQKIAVKCQNVSFRHGTDYIFKDFNLCIKPGQWVIISGTSGSGKSTLAKLLTGWYQAQSGNISIMGEPANSWPPQDGLTHLTWLMQNSYIFSGSIADNLRLANLDISDDELWQVLEMVELKHRIVNTKQGLDTWIGEAGLPLSGGEKQRLALARTLLSNQPIVLLDEPFKGVDNDTASKILEHLYTWGNKKTLLWFAHEQSILPKNADVHINIDTLPK